MKLEDVVTEWRVPWRPSQFVHPGLKSRACHKILMGRQDLKDILNTLSLSLSLTRLLISNNNNIHVIIVGGGAAEQEPGHTRYRQAQVKPRSERGHHWNAWMPGWPLRARLCTCPEISPESNSVQTLQKSFGWDYTETEVPRVRYARKKTIIRTLKTCPAEFGELWKQQNNPACTKMMIMATFVADGRRRRRRATGNQANPRDH